MGALIPPSAPIILFALLTEASIGQLFVAAVIPGLLAAALYMTTIALFVRMNPTAAPIAEPRVPGELRAAFSKAGPVTILFGAVIGGLYAGVFTATESAAVGAIGAFVMAAWRGKLNRHQILSVMGETTAITAMIYMLIFGAMVFSFFVGVSQLPETLTGIVGGLNVQPLLIIALLLLVYLLLGSVMDSFAIMIITVPIVTPLILGMGYDLIWWGIIMLVIVETGLITPFRDQPVCHPVRPAGCAPDHSVQGRAALRFVRLLTACPAGAVSGACPVAALANVKVPYAQHH